MQKTLVVAGGGAAGFFCAVTAARLNPGLKVILVEKTGKLLSKVKVSGGGRCNLTHACFSIPEMVKKYPRGGNFVKKTFHQFFTTDTIKWFDERKVLLKTEADGRMFPVTNSSQTIIDCLLQEAEKYGVSVMMNTEVKSVDSMVNRVESSEVDRETGETDKVSRQFILQIVSTANQPSAISHLTADFVCIASGGYPKSSMFDWLKNTGHTIEDQVPSLFTFNMRGNDITKLMGISVENVKVKIAGTKLESTGPLLITHWGLSG